MSIPRVKGCFTGMVMLLGVALSHAQEIEFNDDRLFEITRTTEVTRNGDAAPIARMIQIGTGYRARIQIGTGVAGLARGSLASIDYKDRLIGPVSSVDPLMVFSIPVVVTADTQVFAVPDGNPANLQIGDEVLVSGFSETSSGVLASRLELASMPLDDWRIEGYATGVGVSTFSIGNQVIDYTGATIEGCDGGMVPEGGFVEVEAPAIIGFVNGQTLLADEVECEDDRIEGEGEAVVEGTITAILAAGRFTVGTQEVLFNSQTRFENGTPADIEEGVRVEVEGSVDATGVLVADKIEIKENKVRFVASVDPADVNPGDSIQIMSNLVLFTSATRDEDEIAAGGLIEPTQIEVRGFIDSAGNIFANRVRERGNPDNADAEIRGPAADIAAPDFTILGVAVNTAGAQFRDGMDAPIDSATFFATIVDGTPVSVEGGLYDPGLQQISGGIVSIEDEGMEDDSTPGRKGLIIGRGLGVVTGQGDTRFRDGFEF